jgi:hypothetical protein
MTCEILHKGQHSAEIYERRQEGDRNMSVKLGPNVTEGKGRFMLNGPQ